MNMNDTLINLFNQNSHRGSMLLFKLNWLAICLLLCGCNALQGVTLGGLNQKNDICPQQSTSARIQGNCPL